MVSLRVCMTGGSDLRQVAPAGAGDGLSGVAKHSVSRLQRLLRIGAL